MMIGGERTDAYCIPADRKTYHQDLILIICYEQKLCLP